MPARIDRTETSVGKRDAVEQSRPFSFFRPADTPAAVDQRRCRTVPYDYREAISSNQRFSGLAGIAITLICVDADLRI